MNECGCVRDHGCVSECLEVCVCSCVRESMNVGVCVIMAA